MELELSRACSRKSSLPSQAMRCGTAEGLKRLQREIKTRYEKLRFSPYLTYGDGRRAKQDRSTPPKQ